ncbi:MULTISPECIES: hypothetical protein [Bacteria]|jgi:hypothetical protein|uniref:hypothetical protein n=1 Tax=Bacteria TaxID=2 RepID=UPI00192C318D|nr:MULTISPECIES: hypothetical protein [Bacteria]MBL5841132.1 hypothetical protein [Enterobacter asburiae]MCC3723245.1 hypothetical protein [Staphylococcus haemolyticus]
MRRINWGRREADNKMVNIKRSIQRLVPQYRVVTSGSDCSCHIDDDCDCMPSLYLTERGCTGFGGGHWTYTDETCPKSIDSWGKAYWCEFLGLPGFWAMGEEDAAETLRDRLDSMCQCANINGVNNKRAEALIAELNSTKENN